ncbi:MAG: efflux RND transporter permease subunit [Candidatus Omnitrophica bacterium]|nr:efflux RND transporter permease subunit [Candidatus Omnitrophota bacterium]
MRLPEFGVKYPVTTTMIFVAMIILGFVSLSRLGLDLMPEIEIPTIAVVTSYEAAGPEEVESKITKVLEDRLATVRNLDSIESTSEEGISAIMLKFDWGINLDEAANDVRDMVDLSDRFLPDDVDRPMVLKFDLSMMPILVLAITADESYPILYDLIDDRICDPLKTIPGVAAATIRGGLERQILVEVDRSRLEAYHLSINQIISVLRQENLDITGGHIKTGLRDYLIRTPEEVEVGEIEKIVLKTTDDGKSVYVKDVATVSDAFKEKTQEVEVNRRNGLIVLVQKQSGANTVRVSEDVLKKVDELKKNLPSDVEIFVPRDFSDFIKGSLGNLKNALFFGGILVILIIFFFLRSLRAGLIVASAIPTSLIIAFFLIYLRGYTLNILSVSSLAIALGMVVDASIVVLDNIYRHREKGERAKEAAIFGATEVGKAITASTLTTIVIFVPLVFVGGISSIMFEEMAFVICLTLVASLFTALTLIPMLSAKFLILKKEKDKSKKAAKLSYFQSEIFFDKLDSAYRDLLLWALSNRKKVIIGGFLIFLLSLLLLPMIGTQFMPEVDSNLFRGTVELPVGTRFEETGKVMESIADTIIKEVPEKNVMFTRWGSGGEGMGRMMGGQEGSNIGSFGVRLTPKEERKRPVRRIVDELRPLTAKYPGAEVRYSVEDPMSGMLYAEGKPLVIEIYGHDLDEGMNLAEEIANGVKKITGAVDVEISRKMGKPELQIQVDRDKAASLDLNISDIGNSVQVFFSGKDATKYREKGKEYEIFVRLREEDRRNIADLENSFITSPSGEQVRLTNIAHVIEKTGPVAIERKDQERVIKVSANLSGRDLGSVAGDVKKMLSGLSIPKDFFVEFGGEREEQEEAFGLLSIALLLGMVLVYMVMASQFESFRDPFIILFSIPFGMIGVVLVHIIFRQVFNVDSFIGLIMIVGIVVNNAIVLISYINILRARGLSVKEAVSEGGRARLRPVLMTTFTTVCGLLPLTLSRGEGSEEWVVLGLTVIGGLLVSMMITLVFIPTLYSVFEERVKESNIKAFAKNILRRIKK